MEYWGGQVVAGPAPSSVTATAEFRATGSVPDLTARAPGHPLAQLAEDLVALDPAPHRAARWRLTTPDATGCFIRPHSGRRASIPSGGARAPGARWSSPAT